MLIPRFAIHPLGTVTAAAALLLACGGGEGPLGEPTGPSVTRGPLTLTPIEFIETDYRFVPDRVDAEQGRLRVPLFHAATGTDSIEIHFVRFASTTDTPGPPIVYLAGGPGGSGTWSSSGDRFGLFQALREVGDVIALDQRGTYYAEPNLVCPGSWDYPLDQPADPDVLAAARRPFLEECYAYWSDSVDLAAFNTWESAEDLDDLREALGAEQLVVWGISYGTHLGLAYLRQHPDRVHRAIFAGTEGPDHTYKLPSNLDRILLRVDSAMKADPRASALMPDFVGALRELVAQLAEEPARVEVTHEGERRTVVIGPRDLQRAVYGELGESEDIVELLARGIPVLEGDFSDLARGLADGRLGNRERAMSIAMDCASGATAPRLALIEEQARTALLGDVGTLSLSATCSIWPANDLGDEFRTPVESDVPVLFISGTLDPRTPPSNAEEMRAGLPNSHHLLVEGGSHDDDLLIVSPLIGETMLAFLRGETDLPERVMLPPYRFALP
jgi:pimeloyl-ACP methyl ester carboxylesterase